MFLRAVVKSAVLLMIVSNVLFAQGVLNNDNDDRLQNGLVNKEDQVDRIRLFPPFVSPIPAQRIHEGESFERIELDEYVTDADNTDRQISWTVSGNMALDVSINDDRVATIRTPHADWYGTESITFTARDPSGLRDSETAAFRVDAVNDAPVTTSIPEQRIEEGERFSIISLDNFVSDVDNVDSELSWSVSGNHDLRISISGSHIATIDTPHPDWNGSEVITFTVRDPAGLYDNVSVPLTVRSVPDAPVVSTIPDQTIEEGRTFNWIILDNYVSDVDNIDSEMSWTSYGNHDLTVMISASRIVTIGVPNPEWSGSERIYFTARDPDGLSDTESAVFTVVSVPDAPVVSNIPGQQVNEGGSFQPIELDGYVTDPDNSDAEISWTFDGNSDLTVTLDPNRIATINAPYADWNGSEMITFIARDPGGLYSQTDALFTVTSINDAPHVSSIPNQTISEGGIFHHIELNEYVEDIDSDLDEMVWTYSGNANIEITIDGNNIATFAIPDEDWYGTETIVFKASDPEGGSDFTTTAFTVTAVNDAPVVSYIPDQQTSEGGSFSVISLDAHVSDVDNMDSELAWTYSGNSALIVSIDGDRVTTIGIPDENWHGSEAITFTATDPDGLSSQSETVFSVNSENDAPVVSAIPNQQIEEGDTFQSIELDLYVVDADNIDSEMIWSHTGNSDLTVSIDGNRVAIIAIPDENWYGSETITFTATDPGGLSDLSETVFSASAVNDAPVISDIPDQQISEGESFELITLDTYVEDVDNGDSEIVWTVNQTQHLTASISPDRVASVFASDPDYYGSESILFTATDAGGLSACKNVVFTITHTITPPDFSTSLLLDGTTGYMDILNPVVNTESFTIEAWANMDNTDGSNMLFHQGSGTGTPFYETITIKASDPSGLCIVSVRTERDGPLQTLSVPQFPPNEWHHYALVVSPDDIFFYLDGFLVAQEDHIVVPGFDYVYSTNTHIGYASGGYFNGSIDEIRIWNRNLNIDEIRTTMETTIQNPESNASLAAYWNFDDGTSEDISGQGYIGTLVHGSAITNRITPLPPAFASSLLLDGQDDYLQFQAPILTSNSFFPSNSFTFSAWVKPEGQGGGYSRSNSIFNQADTESGSIYYLDSRDWSLVATINRPDGNTAETLTPIRTLEFGNWQHLALVVTTAYDQLFLDGLLISHKSADETNLTFTRSVDYSEIGRYRDSSTDFGFFNGSMDEISVWDVALTSSDIMELMSESFETPESIENLVGYWNFNSNDADDQTLSGNDGSLMNGASFTGLPKRRANRPLPSEFAMAANYPNPFNPTTMLSYELPKSSQVQLTIYDIGGSPVITLVNTEQSAGYYNIVWDARDGNGKPVSSGTYIYHMQMNGFSQTGKMLLLK